MTSKTEIPHGSEQEQAKESKAETSASKPQSKVFLYAAFLGFVILVALLVAFVPDWKKSNSSSQEDQAKIDDPQNEVNETLAEGRAFQSSTGPFNATLPLFSSSITEGYNSREELASDLHELAKTILNQAITSNLGSAGSRDKVVEDMPVNAPMAPGGGLEEEAADADFADDGESTADVDSATDFSTNNQEENVDRADFIKADNDYIYAAYGDYLLVWAVADGKVVAKIQMPALANPKYPPDDTVGPPILEPLPEVVEASPETISEGGAADEGEMMFASEPAFDYYWNPKPNIEAILLEGNFLTLAVTGYGAEKAQSLVDQPVLSSYQATQIRVYEHDGNGNFELKSSTDVNGVFRNAYAVGGNAHIVTYSAINTWHHLSSPIQRYLPEFKGLDDEQYQKRAAQIAKGLIDPFVSQLLQELDTNGEVDLARLAVFADSLSADNFEEQLFGGDIASAISQVTSFDMTAGQGKLSLSMAATFQPGHWGHVYATEGMIIVADQGWTWIEEEGLSGQKTYLIGFRLDGASSSHALVGSVDGYMLNSFSLDFVERDNKSYVRIATTQSFWTPWIRPVFEGDVVDDIDMIEEEPVDMVDTVVQPPESSTLNKIIVLEIPNEQNDDGDNVLREVGSVELGEPNERFTTVRFFDNFAYAVTFEQTDPFYVVDLTEEKPEKVGELKIPGFSEYLHAIDSNNQFLVAIGQNADNEGRVLGFQLSLFDATDPANPKLVNRLDVENDENAWSGSTAAWDERAFRFLKLGEKTGKVIIPLSISTWSQWDDATQQVIEPPPDSNFEGFVVFDISNEVITKEFEIDHGSLQYFNEAQCGWWYNWLPERSFVFSGDVMTMRGYTVMSTSLSTGALKWSLDINDLSLGCPE